MLFCCLRRNVETSCHKHFVDVFREQQTTPLTTSGSVTTCHGSAAACWQHLVAIAALTASWQWSQILAQNRDFCLPHLHLTLPLGKFSSKYCHAVWYGKKLEWLGYPMVKIFLRCVFFVLTQLMNVTDTQTDRQTPHDGIGRAYA